MLPLCSLNPYADFAYDGLLLDPMEVVFVKVKRFQLEANWGSARLAAAYSRWMDQKVSVLHVISSCSMPGVPTAAAAACSTEIPVLAQNMLDGRQGITQQACEASFQPVPQMIDTAHDRGHVRKPLLQLDHLSSMRTHCAVATLSEVRL